MMKHTLKIFDLVVWFFSLIFAFDNIQGVRDFSAANPDMVKMPEHIDAMLTASLSIVGVSFAAALFIMLYWLIVEVWG